MMSSGKDLKSLKTKLRMVRKPAIQPIQASVADFRVRQCKICDLVFRNFEEFSIHTSFAHPPKKRGAAARSRSPSLEKGGKKVFSVPAPAPAVIAGGVSVPAPGRIPCDKCDKTYSNMSNRNAHKRTAHPPTPDYVHIPKKRKLNPKPSATVEKAAAPPPPQRRRSAPVSASDENEGEVGRHDCKICNKSYAQAASLYRHRKRFHGITSNGNKGKGKKESSGKAVKLKRSKAAQKAPSPVGLSRGKPDSFLANSRPTPRMVSSAGGGKVDGPVRRRLFKKTANSEVMLCKDCNIYFDTVQELMEHIRGQHENEEGDIPFDQELNASAPVFSSSPLVPAPPSTPIRQSSSYHLSLIPTYSPHSPVTKPRPKRQGTPYPKLPSVEQQMTSYASSPEDQDHQKRNLRKIRHKPAKLADSAPAAKRRPKRAQEVPSVCSLCGRQYTAVRSLRRHVNKSHPEHILVEVDGSGTDGGDAVDIVDAVDAVDGGEGSEGSAAEDDDASVKIPDVSEGEEEKEKEEEKEEEFADAFVVGNGGDEGGAAIEHAEAVVLTPVEMAEVAVQVTPKIRDKGTQTNCDEAYEEDDYFADKEDNAGSEVDGTGAPAVVEVAVANISAVSTSAAAVTAVDDSATEISIDNATAEEFKTETAATAFAVIEESGDTEKVKVPGGAFIEERSQYFSDPPIIFKSE